MSISFLFWLNTLYHCFTMCKFYFDVFMMASLANGSHRSSGHNLAKLDSGWWAGVQRRQKVDCQETCMQLSWPSKQINLTLFMQGQRFQYGCHNHNRLSALFSVLCISKEWSTDEDNSVLRFSTTEDFFSLSKRWKVGNFSPTIPPLMYVYIWSYVSHTILISV